MTVNITVAVPPQAFGVVLPLFVSIPLQPPVNPAVFFQVLNLVVMAVCVWHATSVTLAGQLTTTTGAGLTVNVAVHDFGFSQLLVAVNTTDFIFVVLCEELGILIGFAIIILYFLLFYRCMRAAVYVEDKFSRLLSVGYSAMIASQAIVIIGGVTNMIPLTGVTLPLVSYGGSSMLITFFSLGIIQKISEEG